MNLDPTFLISIVIVLSIHECAHAYVADYLGDPTARLKGRLTLNPLAHLDILGSLAFIFFGFGWAKPVPVDPYNLDNPRRDNAIIALAGPVSNLITAIILALIIRFTPYESSLASSIIPFFYMVTQISVLLAVFNLIPIHPLDGGKILTGFLPRDQADRVNQFLNQYGAFLLIILIFTGAFGTIITPIVHLIMNILL
jgi:Zn-dependent protease